MKKLIMIVFVVSVLLSFSASAKSNLQDLSITLQSTVISLDPGMVQDSQSLFVSRQVNCQLVRSQASTYVLDAAESIQYITPLQIRLKINPKAKFHDGSPITSDDVVASFNYIKSSRSVFRSIYIWVNNIKIVDSNTIIFSLNKPVPQFLKVLSSVNNTIFKKDFLEKAKTNKSLWKHPLGCGGYKVDKFEENYVRLEPIDVGIPIMFHIIRSNQILAADMGKYDLISLNVIGQSKNFDHYNAIELLDPIQYFIGLNAKSKIWRNKYERCSFLSRLNSKDLLRSYQPNVFTANDILPKGTLGYSYDEKFDNKIKLQSNNISKKSKSIDERKICIAYLTVSIQEKYKDKYLEMVKEFYPNISLLPLKDVSKFGVDFTKNNCDILFLALKAHYFDGYEFLTIFDNNDANFSGIHDKNLENDILSSQDIANPINRAKAYRKIINKTSDYCVIKPLFTVPYKRIYAHKDLKLPDIGLVAWSQYYLGNVSR